MVSKSNKIPSSMNISIRSLCQPNSRFLIVQHGVCRRFLPGLTVGTLSYPSSFSWELLAFRILSFFILILHHHHFSLSTPCPMMSKKAAKQDILRISMIIAILCWGKYTATCRGLGWYMCWTLSRAHQVLIAIDIQVVDPNDAPQQVLDDWPAGKKQTSTLCNFSPLDICACLLSSCLNSFLVDNRLCLAPD